MINYIAQRLLIMVPTLIGISLIITWFAVRGGQ